ncbi:MAG: hypothetical protein ACFE9W_10735 [Promethearchaeota archaeon]
MENELSKAVDYHARSILSVRGLAMVVSQVINSQLQIESTSRKRSMTVYSPPGLFIETAKYPILAAGILATSEASEWLSIYDYPDSWRGLERDAIFNMRRKLLRFVLPVDSVQNKPTRIVEVLRILALSSSPITLNVQVDEISHPELHSVGGLLPCGPTIKVSDIEILSEPEISKVAQRVTEMDIPTTEAIWNLLNFDYSLDQIARLMSVGLLGSVGHRRMMPLRSAYKAAIDSIISRCIIELADCSRANESKIYMSTLFGDSFTVLSVPGEPRVDYLRTEKRQDGLTCTSSLDVLRCPSADSKTSVHADNARFSTYHTMATERQGSHHIIFHFSRSARNNSLGPWITRAGVKEALLSTPVAMEDTGNALAVLDSVLRPELGRWALNSPLLDLIELEEAAHPLVHTAT